MTREEYQAQKVARERMRQMEQKHKQAARGSMDLPFLILTVLLTVVGLIMLFSASFPRAYYDTGDGTYYFKRQALFAAVGMAAMFVIAKINYQRWRGASRMLVGLALFLLILCTGAVLMIVGGIQGWLVGAGVGGVAALGFLFIRLAEKGIIKYGAARIAMWHDPWLDYSGDGYQLAQSLITIGSGGLLGVGFGRSRQKFLYLPEQYNDFIFSVVCEELGLIGACVIMLIFALLILRGFWIALHARDRFGALLTVGIMTHLALQTFLNIAVVSGFVPTTGISLPFFSYGGTALCLQLAEMGIVLSVSRQIPAPKAG